MVIADSALNTGNKVAVINFAGGGDMLIQRYTTDVNNVHNAIMTYYCSGTVFPTTELIDLVNSNRKKQHLYIITDTGFHNSDSAINYLDQALRLAKGGGTLFLSSSYGEDGAMTMKFKDIGYNVHSMSRQEDLLAVTKKTAKELYG
jgi:hypothetical protein